MDQVLETIQKGGYIMYPLILCSIIALALSIERIYHLRKARVDSKKLMKKLKMIIEKGNYDGALLECESTPGPLARVLATVINMRNLPYDELQEGLKATFLNEIPRLERSLNMLSTIVTISPLLGLLGTISGLMKLFAVISYGKIGNPEALAGGIAEALITTFAGLTIAIPFLIIHNVISTNVDNLINEMERGASELLSFIKEKGERK